MTLKAGIAEIARALLGEPDPELSIDDQLWFGEDLMVDTASQTFHDYKAKHTGDARALARHLKGGEYAGDTWLIDQGFAERPSYQSHDRDWLPPDLQHERDFLGLLIYRPDIANACGEDVGATDFAWALHGELFLAIQDAVERDEKVSLTVVLDALARDPSHEVIAGWSASRYVAHLIANAPTRPTDPELATLARDLAKQITRIADQERGDLLENQVEDWRPAFGLMMYGERHAPPREYEYLVEDLIPEQEISLMYGPSGCGKSFLATDLSMCGARGVSFFGRRILRPFGVLYCAYEAADGFSDRLRAYEVEHDLRDEAIPFALWRWPAPIWDKDGKNIDLIIKEAQQVERFKFAGMKLGLLVIDTHNAATPGASEIDSEIVSKLRARYHKIRSELGCALLVVGHTNQLGRHRGNEQFYNNIETAILVQKKSTGAGKNAQFMRDENGVLLREAVVDKQRQGQDGHFADFILRNVEVGRIDKFGKPRTSCVVLSCSRDQDDKPRQAAPARTGDNVTVRLNDRDVIFFRSLLDAIAHAGIAPPAALQLPGMIARVCTTIDFGAEYRKRTPREASETDDKYEKRVRGYINTTRNKLSAARVIGIAEHKEGDSSQHLIWPTGRPVAGRSIRWPSERPTVVPKEQGPIIDPATGKPIEQLF